MKTTLAFLSVILAFCSVANDGAYFDHDEALPMVLSFQELIAAPDSDLEKKILKNLPFARRACPLRWGGPTGTQYSPRKKSQAVPLSSSALTLFLSGLFFA